MRLAIEAKLAPLAESLAKIRQLRQVAFERQDRLDGSPLTENRENQQVQDNIVVDPNTMREYVEMDLSLIPKEGQTDTSIAGRKVRYCRVFKEQRKVKSRNPFVYEPSLKGPKFNQN